MSIGAVNVFAFGFGGQHELDGSGPEKELRQLENIAYVHLKSTETVSICTA
jgi:hypothetical protein